jgi:hypothetical protein
MVWDKKESWMELCELAAQETDPKKLMALIAEIDRLWEAKHQCVAAPASVTQNPAKMASGIRHQLTVQNGPETSPSPGLFTQPVGEKITYAV